MAYRIIDYNRRVYSKTKQKTMSKAISRNCVFSFQVRLNQPAAAHLADAQGTPVCRGTPVENHCTILLNILKFKFILMLITGLVIWTVMNLVVIPLSKIPSQHFHFMNVIEDMAALILAYGLPITLIANKYYNSKSLN